MPRSSDYVTINNLVMQNENDKVDEYFMQIHNIFLNNDYSIDEIIRIAEQQVDIAANVIDTGETYEQEVGETIARITPESAPDDLLDGLWLYVASTAYKTLMDEDYIFSVRPANFRVAVETFLDNTADVNKNLVRTADETPQEEPAEEPQEEPAEEPEKINKKDSIVLPHKIILLFYNELKNNREQTLKVLNDKYNLDKLASSESKKFKMNGRLREFYNSYIDQIIVNTMNIEEGFDDLNTLAEALKLYSLLFSLPEEYIVLSKNKIIRFDEAYIHRTYHSSAFLGLTAIYYSLNKINELNKAGFADIKNPEAEDVYRVLIKTFADPSDNQAPYIKESMPSFTRFAKIKEDIDKLAQEEKIKKELQDKEAIFDELAYVRLRGW